MVYLTKRPRRASAVACDVIDAVPVLPTTRSPSTKQTRIRAALNGSTPSANLPAAFARERTSATRDSMALKKLPMRRSTSASRPASSMAVATSRHHAAHCHRSCGQRSRQGRPADRRPALCGGRVRYPSGSGHRQCSDRAHAERASACRRKQHRGCRARASSREGGPAGPWRDNRATRRHASRVRRRHPGRSFWVGHGATALRFGGSLVLY